MASSSSSGVAAPLATTQPSPSPSGIAAPDAVQPRTTTISSSSAGVAANVVYAPQAVVAARPVVPAKRSAAAASDGHKAQSIAMSKEKHEAIDQAIGAWYDTAVELSEDLSRRYGNKADYYLRRMFSGGASMQKARKPTAYNAWAHTLAKEKNQDAAPGEATNLLDLKCEHGEEYHALSRADKRELIASFEEERNSRKMGLRVNPRGRTQDVNNTCEKIEEMIVGLKCRVGIDGFYCIFKNNSEFQMRPRWFFTTPQLNRYLSGTIKKWDVEVIGGLGEAFAIAGCDLMAFLRNSKARGDWLKTEIRERINFLLVKITGKKTAVMQYKSYDKDIVLGYGVELVGWTHDVFACPSSLPSPIEPLQTLLQALDDGKCYFRRLDSAERAARQRAYNAKVASGAAPARAERSDKGKKRGKYQPRKKAVQSAVQDEEENGEGDGEETARAAKRRRRDDKARSSDED
ncbi:hypothetical protein K466DRAFT_605606 [Polyporus arcularius HHB13444]|uniref:Uncharacterized protein n=1 Tax=Polyporus arcularius HHB13444 TaxID=1314778 RepID=A0A5C3NS87_9APHY|nr:hypothetical protein K466DRAFT_605606 [Polyporus arcularius HHB13444]